MLGRKECTAAGVRRLARWAAAFPGTAVVAFVGEDNALANADLRAAGVDVLLRREPTPARMVERPAQGPRRAGPAGRAGPHRGGRGGGRPARRGRLADELAPADLATLVPGPRAEDEAAPEPAPVKGAVLTIASATGGCGKTFFATNLAALLADSGLRVLLVDMDLQFGEVAAALRVRHPYSVYDGLYDAAGRPLPENDLSEHLDALVAHHALGFDVLTAPREPALADYVGARDVGRVLDVVTDRYEVVLVDTPPSLNEVVLTALDRSDLVVVLATLDVPSLKNLTVFLDTLHRLKVDDSVLRLVMNKVEPDVGIDMPQAQQAFDDRFVSSLAAVPCGQPLDQRRDRRGAPRAGRPRLPAAADVRARGPARRPRGPPARAAPARPVLVAAPHPRACTQAPARPSTPPRPQEDPREALRAPGAQRHDGDPSLRAPERGGAAGRRARRARPRHARPPAPPVRRPPRPPGPSDGRAAPSPRRRSTT